MNCRDLILSEEGNHAYRIVLPCFEAELSPEAPDNPEFAERMNRFYGAAADALVLYAKSLLGGGERRIAYSCRYEVSEEEGTVEVRLLLSLRRTGQKPLRRTLLHRWKEGALLSASAEPDG